MTREQVPPLKPGTDDDARTEEARRVIEEYASQPRELLQRLRKWFN